MGDLEKRFIHDSYSSDLADYYSTVNESQLLLLSEAQENVKAGFDLCLKNNFNLARQKFEIARKLFVEAGDNIEAETICDHFIAYCYYNTDRQKMAYELLFKVNDFCKLKSYKWFLLMNLDWLLGAEELLGYKSFNEIEKDYQNGLADAERIKDNYTIQKLMLALIRKNQFIRQEKHVFDYLHKLFLFSKEPNISERQKLRCFDKAIPIFALSRFQDFSKEVSLESIAFTEPMSDPLFAIGSEINAGIVHMQAGSFDVAQEWLTVAMRKAEHLPKESKEITIAKIFSQMARLEKTRGDLLKAAEFYDRSLRILKRLNTPVFLYETKKSRLIVYQELGDNAEVEKDIYSTLKLAENYRKQILDEQERNSFFDNEQDIYDVAVEHEMRLNRSEAAYDYAELSNSRSLLDLLNRGADVSFQNQEVKIVLKQSSNPLKIRKIRERMPEDVQILHYTVLGEKVLIWVITKESFMVVSAEKRSGELKSEIEEYLASINTKEPSSDISRRLYEKLISPALPYLDATKEICIIPDKILFHLPFSTLISPEGKYLLEDMSLFYSPSANIFLRLSEKAKERTTYKDERVLSIGNPTFNPEQFPQLRNLPEAEAEALEISKNYRDPKVLIREEATKHAFQQYYQDFEVIHFAGHYSAQPDRPLMSKLIMASDPENERDSFLTNAELISRKLPKTKLIVLSACQTGIEKYSDGEGLFGLSRTFLSLGVPVVVASQWKIDSVAAAELMKSFHYFRRQKMLSTSRALRQAQLEQLKNENGPFRSAYFWGAFAVFGGYAEF